MKRVCNKVNGTNIHYKHRQVHYSNYGKPGLNSSHLQDSRDLRNAKFSKSSKRVGRDELLSATLTRTVTSPERSKHQRTLGEAYNLIL